MEGRDTTVITRTVDDLDEEIDLLLAEGYRLDMIMPADDPQFVEMSRCDERVRLARDLRRVRSPAFRRPTVDTRADGVTRPLKGGTPNAPQYWVTGRAGMEYRDLIPDRLGGLLIASHIRIMAGGEVPDYVHYHKLLFQMIYCKSGWIRVVYEDQGPPFVMQAGDCVLQPPEIRHRVLESSPGAEVVEVSAPAVHETWVDHDLSLPTQQVDRNRSFSGQRFVRHIVAEAVWENGSGVEYCDTGIAEATDGKADVRIVRYGTLRPWAGDTTFLYVLNGEAEMGDRTLQADDNVVISPYATDATELNIQPGAQILQVTISADLAHFFFATSVPTDREP